MWKLRNKTEDHKGRGGRIILDKIRESKRLLTIRTKLRVAGGQVGGGMGYLGDGH